MLGRMNPSYSHAPEMLFACGYATFASTVTVANTVIALAKFAPVVAANGAVLGQSYTIGPDTRVPVVAWPTTAYASQVAAGTSSSVVMLDCRQFSADIISIDASYVPPAPTAGTLGGGTVGSYYALGIDNVNKFVYFAAYSVAGTAIAPPAGSAMQWSVTFKDITAV